MRVHHNFVDFKKDLFVPGMNLQCKGMNFVTSKRIYSCLEVQRRQDASSSQLRRLQKGFIRAWHEPSMQGYDVRSTETTRCEFITTS